MGEIGSAYVTVSADVSKYKVGMKDVMDHSRNAAESMDSMSRASSGLLGKLAQFGVAAYGIHTVTSAVGSLVGEFNKLTNEAFQHEAAQARLENAVKNTGVTMTTEFSDNIKKAINDLGDSTGYTNEELYSAFTFLTTATGSYDEGLRRLKLSTDAAATSGYGLTAVSRLLGRENEDNYQQLQRLGVPVREIKKEFANTASAAEIAAFAHLDLAEAQGILSRGGKAYTDILHEMGRDTSKATASTAAYAEANRVLEKDVAGAAANIAKANPTVLMQRQMGEFQHELGALLVPAQKVLLTVGTDLAKGLRESIADPHKLQAVKWFGDAIAGGAKTLVAFAKDGIPAANEAFKASFGIEMPKSVTSFLELLGTLKDAFISFAGFLGIDMGKENPLIGPDAVDRNRQTSKTIGDALKEFAHNLIGDVGGALDIVGGKFDSFGLKGTIIKEGLMAIVSLEVASKILDMAEAAATFGLKSVPLLIFMAGFIAAMELSKQIGHDDPFTQFFSGLTGAVAVLAAAGPALALFGAAIGSEAIMGFGLALTGIPLIIASVVAALVQIWMTIDLIRTHWDQFKYAWDHGLLDNVILIGDFKRAISGITEVFLAVKLAALGVFVAIGDAMNENISALNGLLKTLGLPLIPKFDTSGMKTEMNNTKDEIVAIWTANPLKAKLDTTEMTKTIQDWMNSHEFLQFKAGEHTGSSENQTLDQKIASIIGIGAGMGINVSQEWAKHIADQPWSKSQLATGVEFQRDYDPRQDAGDMAGGGAPMTEEMKRRILGTTASTGESTATAPYALTGPGANAPIAGWSADMMGQGIGGHTGVVTATDISKMIFATDADFKAYLAAHPDFAKKYYEQQRQAEIRAEVYDARYGDNRGGAYADGGIIASPQFAKIGEGGPEIALTKDNVREFLGTGANSVNLGGITIMGNVDSPERTTELGRDFSRRARLLLQRV